MPTKADSLRRDAPRQRQQPAPPAQSRPAPARSAAPERKPQPAPTVITDTRAAPRPRPRPMVAAPPDEKLLVARDRHDEAETMLHRAEQLAARPYMSYRAPRAPQLPGRNAWLIMAVVILLSLGVIVGMGGPGGTSISRWGATLFDHATNSIANAAGSSPLAGAARSAGDYALQGAPSITAQQIDAILASYGSPAAGTGAAWYNLGLKYGIDPAYAVAFFIHESSAGTNAAWAGLKPGGASTHNVGNIICAGYATCYGRFRDYGSWDEGIEDWYRLIDVEYIKGRGTQTVKDIIPIYAPSFENDVQAYINSVTNMVDGWRANGVH
ncbi:glucosaminidase domain-containing protein [Oscillochloris sp. ZM17-4]|nr:glucosaminidase domain-containing protein [Oscillochloris sp. ZM17-4]MBX0327794.1 glucosaminidase domain-containing protein [Oscillochloris sp. ZM17-4]